jgi:hypothetical protein
VATAEPGAPLVPRSRLDPDIPASQRWARQAAYRPFQSDGYGRCCFGTQTLTKWGLANLISNVTFFDLGNNQRINSTGWHLTIISSAKRRAVFGAAYTTDTPLGYGNNNNRVMFAPAIRIAPNGSSSEIDFELEIPFVKNDQDLRGAIFADVTQATMQVQLTLNPNMFVSFDCRSYAGRLSVGGRGPCFSVGLDRSTTGRTTWISFRVSMVRRFCRSRT